MTFDRRMTVRCTTKTERAVDKIAKKTRRKKCEVIRIAIERYAVEEGVKV